MIASGHSYPALRTPLRSHLRWLPRRFRAMLSDERGQIAVLAGLAMVAMLGMASLVVDVGIGWVERAQLQNATDAAVLAALEHLPDDPIAAENAAYQYLSLNGVDAADPDVTVTITSSSGGDPNRFEVTAVRERPTLFAGVLGVNTFAPGAAAVAQIGAVDGVAGIMPWGVEELGSGFQSGYLYCLKLGAGNDPTCGGAERGNFHALDIDDVGNASANVYRDAIVDGSTITVSIGDTKSVVNGNMAGPTAQGTGCAEHGSFNGRITGNTQTFSDVVQSNGNSYTVLDWQSPRIVLLPVVTFAQPGNNEATVEGFAVFFLEGCNANASVQGRFFDTVVPGTGWSPINGSNDFGARAGRLVQ